MEKGRFEEGSIVRIKRTNEFARINRKVYLNGQTNFLHYEGEIEGRIGNYCLPPDDELELECLPKGR